MKYKTQIKIQIQYQYHFNISYFKQFQLFNSYISLHLF
jgi:hypothetical protein